METPGNPITRRCFGVGGRVDRIVAILALLSIGQASGWASEAKGNFSPCRCPERDGVNCLYLQLRLLGYAGTYEAVVSAIPEGAEHVSLGELAQAARRLGFALAPAKLTVTELASLHSPTVILFEETGIGHGQFHLLLSFSPAKAHLVDGAFITRHKLTMPIDRFRRGWTGFALVPRTISPWPRYVIGAAVGIGLVMVASWLRRRLAHGSQC